MPSDVSEFYFEPVRIVVGELIEGMSESSEVEELAAEPRGETSGQYFFKKVVTENIDEFEQVDVRSEFSDTLGNTLESVSSKLKKKLSSVFSSEVSETLFRIQTPHYLVQRFLEEVPGLFYIHKKSPSVIIPISKSVFCIVSKKAGFVNSLIGMLRSRFEELSNVTKDFGLELLSFLTSKEYQRTILENIPKVKSVEYGEPINDLEKEVIEVCSKVTSSFLSNVQVAFAEPEESFEYDIFMNFPGRMRPFSKRRIIIEPTDYSSLTKEMASQKPVSDTLKSKIILAIQDKAQRLNAQSIVIVNGFPENSFRQLKTLADSRGVLLMNEDDYQVKLPVTLCKSMLAHFSKARIIRRAVRA